MTSAQRRLVARNVSLFYCLLCCLSVWLITPTRVIHETHFYASAAIRRSAKLNAEVGAALQATMGWIDAYGVSDAPLQLDVPLFRQLAAADDWGALANATIDAMHRLYPAERHNAYHFGLADSWALWTVMMLECAVRPCAVLPVDLHSMNLRNTNAWRGLAGSDDVLWATLMLVDQPGMLDSPYRWNGARGAKQLFAEAENHYVDRQGNMTALFWDTNADYIATICITLWISAAAKLHEKTREPRYLQHALSGVGAILHGENPLITGTGHVYDGRHIAGWINTVEWSYNAGVALGALTALYRGTQDMHYLLIAERIAQTAVQVFWQSGHLSESVATLNRDQWLFKGILLHHMGEFLHVLLADGRAPPHWVVQLHGILARESQWLVAERLSPAGFCVYWGEQDAANTCSNVSPLTFSPQGLATAATLFSVTEKLGILIKHE